MSSGGEQRPLPLLAIQERVTHTVSYPVPPSPIRESVKPDRARLALQAIRQLIMTHH